MPESAQEPSQEKLIPIHKRHKRALICGFIAFVLLVALFALFFRPQATALLHQIFGWVKIFYDALSHAHPFWFYLAFAILPAFGVPLTLFTLTASSFENQIGLGLVVLFSAISLAFNLVLSYWLARYALRPLIEKLIKRLGYKLPVVSPKTHISLCVMLRVLPGPPYVVQSYILGLSKVHFVPYIIISFVGQLGWALAIIFGGKAVKDMIENGTLGKAGLVAIALIIILVIGTRIFRERFAKRHDPRDIVSGKE